MSRPTLRKLSTSIQAAFSRGSTRRRTGAGPAQNAEPRRLTPQEYWSSYNVTGHRIFSSAAESLGYFEWRTSQYFDYLDYMPVTGFGGKAVLDYGCGPGHDLVGFATFSKPSRLVGVDVSRPSIEQARARLALHGVPVELEWIDERDARLPFEDATFDHIHSSGVLHHTPDPMRILRELRRILKPGGEMRLMVYNYDCIWLHLYAAYTVRFKQPGNRDLDVREAFKRSTDTVDCPISHAWAPAEVAEMARQTSFRCEHLGNAVSVREIAILPDRFDAILDPEFESEHRQFLLALTFDARGVPYYRGQAAGIDACYRLTPG
jgi:SAM-dependent methyltransferase